jgi:hypothetical protein
MGSMAGTLELFYRNVQPKLGCSDYMLLHAFRKNKWVAL